jgi:hypothetical protein
MSLPEASRSNRRALPVEVVCEYLRTHVPAGEPFGFGQVLLTVPNRYRAQLVLGKLMSAGVVEHVAFGRYAHTGHFPEDWADVTDRAAVSLEWRPTVKMQAYITEHFSPGVVFVPKDLAVFGPPDRVKFTLVKLRKAGVVITDGFGAYAVPKEAGTQVWPKRLIVKAEIREHVQ